MVSRSTAGKAQPSSRRSGPGTVAVDPPIVAGYAHADYAASLAEFGTPLKLPRSGGWLLRRGIPGVPDHDAMGCYPLFSCRDWSRLNSDLEELRNDLVSVVIVSDPFGAYDQACLRQAFPDVVLPFKEHYIVDLQLPLGEIAGRRHRKNARRALRNLVIEVCPWPTRLLADWVTLYDNLKTHRRIAGISVFSRDAFLRQLSIPGIVMLRAVHQGATVAAQLYYLQDDVAYCHLGAASLAGYELGALFAIDWCSLEHFAGRARWLDLGGGAGVSPDAADGLSAYKRGWSTGTKTVYLCGRILQPGRYAEIVRAKGIGPTGYFPAYRVGEFD